MENLVNKDLPKIIGIESVKVVKDNFKVQGYDNGLGVQGWPQRSAKTNKAYSLGRTKGKQGRYKGSVYQATNPLLLQTRNLYNSVKYGFAGKTVNIGVDTGLIPYAKAMNEGGRGIPARKYIPANGEPPNVKILKKIYGKIDRHRDKIMQNFKK